MLAYLRTKPYSLYCNEGCDPRSSETPVTVKATSEQTGGMFNLFEASCPPGYSTSLHIHYAEDVSIYILEGTLTFFWGSEKMQATAGDYFFQPRGTPHGFRVDSDAPARILYMTVPAGLDRFVMEAERLAPDSESATTAAHYKIEVLGPLPE